MVECQPFDIIFIPGIFKGTRYGLVHETRKDGCLVSPLLIRTAARRKEDIEISSADLDRGKMPVKNFRVGPERRIIGFRDIRKIIGHLKTAKIDRIIRDGVSRLVDSHFDSVHNHKKPFVPGQSVVPYGGRVYDQEEMRSLVDSGLDFWLTAGRFEQEFTKRCEKFLGVRHCLLTNSGSSANLLAISALTSPTLKDRRLCPGDEVITAACAFPTTVNPIVQNRLVPVFLDVDIGTYNVQPERLAAAVSKKTKAIILAHTLGNPFDLDAVMSLARKHRLWVIEDNCDALGSRFRGRYTGTFGDIATLSFYPPHHITMGEGGGVVTGDACLKRLIESFRDWGRDCWCRPGHDNTCRHRFDRVFGSLPKGYDHKYVFSHLGYNLKITDMQASVGVAQIKKLPAFIRARKKNWQRLYQGLKPYEEFFILPRHLPQADPSWFGFLLTVREKAPFARADIVHFLERQRITSRMLFCGNIIRHPGFEKVRHRVVGPLKNTDRVMNQTFWLGVYPGLTNEMLDYVLERIRQFIRSRTS